MFGNVSVSAVDLELKVGGVVWWTSSRQPGCDFSCRAPSEKWLEMVDVAEW